MGRAVACPENLRFPVKKTVVREAFKSFDFLSCHFGDLGFTHRWDSRNYDRPVLHGPVVATLTYSRGRTAMLVVYALPTNVSDPKAEADFVEKVVPHLVKWLKDQVAKPDTALLGQERLLVVQRGSWHEYIQVKFL